MFNSFRRGLGAWFPLATPISPPPKPSELDAFARYCDELTHGFTKVATLIIVGVAVLWWPLDLIVLPPSVASTYGTFRLSMVLFGVTAYAILRRLPPGRAASYSVGVGIAVFNALLGWFLGSLEGLLGIQYMYPLPFASFLLILEWRWRFTFALLAVSFGWLAVAASAGGLPEIAYGTLSSAIGTAIIATLFSESLRYLLMSRFLSELRLSALRSHLEERVTEQGRDLRALARAQIDSLDSEGRWLSRELHDALGQELTAMRVVVDLAAIQLDAGQNRAGRETLLELETLLRRQQTSLRRILARMRPEAVEQVGFLEAVRGLVTEVTRGSDVKADLTVDEGLEAHVDVISPAVADTLYRILQEALSNVVRHAEATSASVTLERDGDSLVLRIADNGKGPDFAVTGGCHVGLLGIRERATLCGGVASWGPGPQRRGMQVDVRLPLKR
ncbi:MAG: sensor histidine kinase [Myxococcales bacterium]|nr:sensor histidine kinase [Myxococcales bacterium]